MHPNMRTACISHAERRQPSRSRAYHIFRNASRNRDPVKSVSSLVRRGMHLKLCVRARTHTKRTPMLTRTRAGVCVHHAGRAGRRRDLLAQPARPQLLVQMLPLQPRSRRILAELCCARLSRGGAVRLLPRLLPRTVPLPGHGLQLAGLLCCGLWRQRQRKVDGRS